MPSRFKPITSIQIAKLIIQHGELQGDREDDVDMAPAIGHDTPQATLPHQAGADMARDTDGMDTGVDTGPPVSANVNGKRPAESRSGKQPPPAKRRVGNTGPKNVGGKKIIPRGGKCNVLFAKQGDIAADFARLLAIEVDPPEPDLPGILECDSQDTIVRGKVWHINRSFVHYFQCFPVLFFLW